MKKLIALFILLPSLAWAQGAILQNGAVTVGELGVFSQTKTMEGISEYTTRTGRGVRPFSILDSQSLGICTNTALTTGTYHSLCFGHDASNNPIFSVDGTSYPFVGGGGNVVGPGSTVVNRVACWNNTTGTLSKQCTTGTTIGTTTDTRVADFGTPILSVLSNGNLNTSLFWAVQDGTGGVPGAINGGCTVTNAGASHYCSAAYFEAALDPAAGGLVQGIEIDTFSKVAPTTTTPFTRGPDGGITSKLPIGLTISAATRTGYTNNSSAAIDIESNGGKFAAAGIYINPGSLAAGAYSVNGGGPALFGDSTLTGPMLTIKGGIGTQDGNGASILLQNTSAGVSAPNKTIHVNGVNSSLEVVDNAGSVSIMSLSDGGFMTLANGIKLKPIAAAGLPVCTNSTHEGQIIPVVDSSSAVFNATFVGGGANHILAYCNGTGWVVH